MHDPETVAFEIRNPFCWRKNRFDGKWEMGRLATVCHHECSNMKVAVES